MIKINDYEVKNTVEELTVKEFEEIAGIQNDQSLDYVEKQIKVFTTLGVDEDVIDAMDIREFKSKVREFNDVEAKEYPFQNEFEIDGFIYKAYDEEFKLSVRDLKHIESKVKKSPSKYMAFMLAVIFKRTDLTKAEHYDNAHLKHKEELFSKLPAAVAVPYVTHIGRELAKAIQDDSAE
jgi:hypothetical protein